MERLYSFWDVNLTMAWTSGYASYMVVQINIWYYYAEHNGCMPRPPAMRIILGRRSSWMRQGRHARRCFPSSFEAINYLLRLF